MWHVGQPTRATSTTARACGCAAPAGAAHAGRRSPHAAGARELARWRRRAPRVRVRVRVRVAEPRARNKPGSGAARREHPIAPDPIGVYTESEIPDTVHVWEFDSIFQNRSRLAPEQGVLQILSKARIYSMRELPITRPDNDQNVHCQRVCTHSDAADSDRDHMMSLDLRAAHLPQKGYIFVQVDLLRREISLVVRPSSSDNRHKDGDGT
jgi:hypothetical protein